MPGHRLPECRTGRGQLFLYRYFKGRHQALPQQSEEEIRMFTLLKKAYIDSRYKIDYEIKKEELEYLSERVKQLRDLTEEVCKEKIGQMK